MLNVTVKEEGCVILATFDQSNSISFSTILLSVSHFKGKITEEEKPWKNGASIANNWFYRRQRTSSKQNPVGEKRTHETIVCI